MRAVYEEANIVDLQLSGHTHKGQFFPNQLFTKRFFEVDYEYLAKDSLQVIVTSGYSIVGAARPHRNTIRDCRRIH